MAPAPFETKHANGNGVQVGTTNGDHSETNNGISKPTIDDSAPTWMKARSEMRTAFPSFYNDPDDDFRSNVDESIQKLERLRNSQLEGPAHFGEQTPFWEQTNDLISEFPEEGETMDNVMSQVVDLFNGVNMTSHPRFQYNIVTHPNKVAIMSTILANYVSLNYSMGFASWNTSKAEVEVGNMIASLVEGWKVGDQGGLFTFGGSGCYLYGMKYAITDVLKEQKSRTNGVGMTKGKIITSRHGHFCNDITSDWLGVGMDSVVLVETQPRTNKMCMIDLERKLKQAQEEKVPVFVVVCTMGTTDSMVFDPVEEVYNLISKYPNPEGYGRPHIYCDSVAGWAFLTFQKYKFEENKLQFSSEAMDLLKRNNEELAQLKYADSIALDFHKAGYSPVTTSMFVAKNGQNFENILSRAPGHILHHRTKYSPGSYSLEVSRSCGPALAAWSTMKFFGLKGFQTLIGGIVEMTMYLRSLIALEPELVCTADIGCGYLTTIRAYPAGMNAKEQWEKEYTQNSDEAHEDIEKYNQFQKKIGDRLWKLSTQGKTINGKSAYLLNYSTNFCSTLYKNEDGSNGPSFYALKIFPTNVHVEKQSMVELVEIIKLVRDQVCAEEEE